MVEIIFIVSGIKMIHYEIALAIIGIAITIMGIIIAFHIGKLHDTYYRQYLETSLKFQDLRGGPFKRVEIYNDQPFKDLEKYFKTQKRELLISVITFMGGLIIILLLIIQTFWWEIDQKTLKISQQNFLAFVVLFAISLIWTGTYIFGVYRFAFWSVSSLLEQNREILKKLDEENDRDE